MQIVSNKHFLFDENVLLNHLNAAAAQ